MTSSPRITGLRWGAIDVEGFGRFKDAKLWPGGGREWDWGETGTRHRPGIQPGDVAELLDHGATTIVLAQGMQGALGIAPDTLAELEAAGVDVEVHGTDDAVAIYNRLRASVPVGGLFHSTC